MERPGPALAIVRISSISAVSLPVRAEIVSITCVWGERMVGAQRGYFAKAIFALHLAPAKLLKVGNVLRRSVKLSGVDNGIRSEALPWK